MAPGGNLFARLLTAPNACSNKPAELELDNRDLVNEPRAQLSSPRQPIGQLAVASGASSSR